MGMRRWGRLASVLSGWLVSGAGALANGLPSDAVPERVLVQPDFAGHPAPVPVQALARWAVTGGDAAGRPFAVVDKPSARIFVFGADGVLNATAPTLLGSAPGDGSAQGVGLRVLTGIPPAERTTPAGRFRSEPGRNLQGEAIVWVDYDAAIAVHRLRPAGAAERRPQRLASATPDDNRITLGCIVVDPAFYDDHIAPLFGRRHGVVYVLPDTQDWRELFPDAAGL